MVRVVVLLVRPPPGKLDAVAVAVPNQVGVDEFGAIVGIDAAQPEGEHLPYCLQGLLHRALAATQDRPSLHPGRGNVREVQGVRELPVARVATVRDEVDLGEARGGDVPPVGPQRDAVLQKPPRLGPAVPPGLPRPPVRGEAPIHLPGAQPEQLRLERGREAEAAARPGEPDGEQRFEAERPRVANRSPDRGQHLNHARAARRAPPGWSRLALGRGPVEQPQGRRPVVAGHVTELVQDPLLLTPTRVLVTGVDRFQVLPSPLSTHDGYPPLLVPVEGNISNGATIDLSVTF